MDCENTKLHESNMFLSRSSRSKGFWMHFETPLWLTQDGGAIKRRGFVRGGRHRAQHAAPEAEEQHFVRSFYSKAWLSVRWGDDQFWHLNLGCFRSKSVQNKVDTILVSTCWEHLISPLNLIE